ncbi:DUF1634 domain-containing protein [Mucilaginibacter robiniae]|uniref:DUF1634 domain-containing protein n=1 Tax=Mucilaginibacter robiniae TaxID=2728022 RepID=A0A7L5E5U7_9SPHI|nr:DUF1634 domain-containing protein [Mucilaginibacter robiniae]QJD97144.1 DUF1634 domain-containing protein [Mucilaginibacter robiniae]
MSNVKQFKDTDIQLAIGWILRLGVIISMSVVFIGGCLYIYRHGYSIANYHEFKGVPNFVHTPAGIWHGILTGHGQAIIQAGILLLVATPVLRILFSAFGFLLEKDYLYVGITLLVLAIIIISALTGHGG